MIPPWFPSWCTPLTFSTPWNPNPGVVPVFCSPVAPAGRCMVPASKSFRVPAARGGAAAAVTTLDDARAAQDTLLARLGRPAWLRGVGVAQDDDGYFVKVNVAAITPEVTATVPSQIGPARVLLEEVGEVVAQPGPAESTEDLQRRASERILNTVVQPDIMLPRQRYGW